MSSTSGRRGTDRHSTAYVLSLGLLVACAIGVTALTVAGGAAITIEDAPVDGSAPDLTEPAADGPSTDDQLDDLAGDGNGDGGDASDGDDERAAEDDGDAEPEEEDDAEPDEDDDDEEDERGPPDHAEADRGNGNAPDEDDRDDDEREADDEDEAEDSDDADGEDENFDEDTDADPDEDSDDFLAELWEELDSEDDDDE